MSSRLRTHAAVAAFAALAATAAVGLVPGRADADRDPHRDLRAENARLRTDLSYVQAANRELLGGLQRIEGTAKQSADRRTRFHVQRIVDDTRSRAARYTDDRDRPDWPDHRDRDHRDRDHRDRYRPLADADFQRLVARVADGFPSETLEVVRTAAAANYFTVDQAVALIKACRFDSARIELGVILYPRVVDVERWFLVDEAFEFSSSRLALKQKLQQGNVQPLQR
jgi:hypothetical protein